jgi:hypothetical protein
MELTKNKGWVENMSNIEKEIFSQLQGVANEHNLRCWAILNIEGGRGWINFGKVEEYVLVRSGNENVIVLLNIIV